MRDSSIEPTKKVVKTPLDEVPAADQLKDLIRKLAAGTDRHAAGEIRGHIMVMKTVKGREPAITFLREVLRRYG